MNIPKAIELLTLHLQHSDQVNHFDLDEAAKLSIEALKKWKILREGRAGIIDPLLPGEDPE